MYKIGNVKLDSRVFLAPLAGVTCSAFRLICKEYGAGLVYSPMIVINQLVEAPKRILEIINPLKQERPLAIQLVGSDTKLMEQAVKIIDPYADIIDINLGCPEKDILALKAGAFFIKHPDQLKKIIPAVMGNTNKPVTEADITKSKSINRGIKKLSSAPKKSEALYMSHATADT